MESLEELGKKAYQKQILGDYDGAIKVYNTAIKKYPNDRRLLNNRCLCYIAKKDFKRAMEDAELMIRLFPEHAKSYYRKGEILTTMKRYIEAEEAYIKVLSLDSECEDARRQLLDVQALQLCEHGYKKEHALKALGHTLNHDTHIANIEDAEKILRYGTSEIFDNNNDLDYDSVYYSDDENACSSVIKADNVYDPLLDPSNPLKSCSLWVGFVTEDVTEKMLTNLFSKYGKILSVCPRYSLHCAFINYADHIAAGKAMKALQGALVGTKNILIRFPDNVASHTKSI
ncbi:hypothetical protein B7P43_G03703 [Cryptotermes secundus]|uniref:RRM domain-containing protein n=1 Tax=Cryptotermes secundus TaxID=105785 RepID=A0A2J7QC95_9NEOP|nr:hsp70-Hsp90 organizing protein 2 isoform X1 [Cryptotermes secundus]PNF26214.1 hypothetical protein B7P43_G03703 [Cryptotermes secundus]